MGLFDLFKKVLGTPDAKAAEAKKGPPARRRWPTVHVFAVPGRHEPRKGPAPQHVPKKPYALARPSRRGGYMDYRPGGDPGQLARFGLPPLGTPLELAAWLKIPLKTLAWFTDYHGSNAGEKVAKKQHYHYQWKTKRRGGYRLLEIPKPLLKLAQQRVLREILDKVPPHSAAHGFVKGRSIRSNAAAHTGRYVVLTMDLREFYPSVKLKRVRAVFRGLGYNQEVAKWLARLCTNRMPAGLKFPDGVRRWEYDISGWHLPQGAPTSPALANLAAWALDVRLNGLAKRFEVAYTRYADDLTFSGDEKVMRGKTMALLMAYVRGIIVNERFCWNPRKRKIVRRGHRQVVTGLTVNEKVNVPRPYFDRLKAILTNCVRHGPASQNKEGVPDFRAHLLGRIGFVRSVNPRKAERLQRVFDRIKW